MRHRAYFRLALKAVGVLLIGQNAPAIFERVAFYIEYNIQRQPLTATATYEWLELALQIVGPTLGMVFGLYLLLGGERIVRLVMPTATPHCSECGYDLTGLLGEQCPECGAAIHQDAEPKREIKEQE